MVDSRITELARILLEYSLEVRPGDSILIQAALDAKPLVLAAYEQALALGAHPWQRIQFPETDCLFFMNANNNQIGYLSPVDLFSLRKFRRFLYIRTETHTKYLRRIDPSVVVRRRRALRPAQEILRTRRWCATFFPSRTLSQRVGMSFPAYADKFFEATNTDWSYVEETGRRLAKYLIRSREVRIEGEGTDLRFSISGRKAIVGSGRFNMPDGEVFTSPIEDSAEGHITFEHPVDFEGHKIEDVQLRFQRGQVVAATAGRGKAALKSLLRADEGASRLGEFGIGINYGLKGTLGHIALDEKIGGTCHLAIGFSPPGTGGRNRSAIHFDLIKDIRVGGRILADGKAIMEDGNLMV